MEVRTPDGYKRNDAPAESVEVDSATTTAVVASKGQAIVGDTTTADIDVELPPAQAGGEVTVINGAGANSMLVTAAVAPATDNILTASGPIVNPATVAVLAGGIATFRAIRITSSVYGWVAAEGAMFA